MSISASQVAEPSGPSLAVAALVARARVAQRLFERYDQAQVDEVVTAAAWALLDPAHNQGLSEQAVSDTGLGRVADKVAKNRRKTLGLLRDLKGARSVGVIAEHPADGIVEIARPVGVVGAVVPSTNPVATPMNKTLNALKGRNAIILAPSPKGAAVCARLLGYIREELARVDAPQDLVQMLPMPVSKALTQALMQQVDLVVVTGSQNNVRGAYASGTPAIGVGAGNVPVIIDATADVAAAAEKIAVSKSFDNATSCSSENSVIILDAVYDRALQALQAAGGRLLDAAEKARLQSVMWVQGKLNPAVVARSAQRILEVAGLDGAGHDGVRLLLVEENGVGPEHPYSDEKLSPVLAVYRAADFAAAKSLAERLLRFNGAGHSIGIHSTDADHVSELAHELPVCRVIVNQPHAIATGGNFDNGLPFSLSMGCGTWGRNSISDNLNYRHFLNTTRIVRTIPPRNVDDAEIFGAFWEKYGIDVAGTPA